jgi:hypothetical protein
MRRRAARPDHAGEERLHLRRGLGIRVLRRRPRRPFEPLLAPPPAPPAHRRRGRSQGAPGPGAVLRSTTCQATKRRVARAGWAGSGQLHLSHMIPLATAPPSLSLNYSGTAAFHAKPSRPADPLAVRNPQKAFLNSRWTFPQHFGLTGQSSGRRPFFLEVVGLLVGGAELGLQVLCSPR